jgi:hypothetical protein
VEHKRTLHKSQNLRNLEKSQIGSYALVAANGPSLLKLNFTTLKQQQELGSLKIFGINYSPLLELGISPDFLILSDHFMHPRNRSETNLKFWKSVTEDSRILLVTPTLWCDALYFRQCANGKCLHFNDFGAEGLIRGISPLKPRGYLSITALKALAISDYLGFEEIGIIGLDNTFYYGLEVSQELNILENSYHASKVQHFNSNLGDYWRLGVSDYFYFVSLNFYYAKKYFSGRRFINMDKKSLVDAFIKIMPDHPLYGLIQEIENG